MQTRRRIIWQFGCRMHPLTIWNARRLEGRFPGLRFEGQIQHVLAHASILEKSFFVLQILLIPPNTACLSAPPDPRFAGLCKVFETLIKLLLS
jgi:hypothetical protein